ncbi:RNA pseudouridine synthase [Flavobacteriaceae bacterium]|nr:RNA pseudouridine synthase [Flavobacteriaceae bacterium]
MKLEILYEDNHLLVINKPLGVLVQGDKTGDLPLVEHAKDYIKHKYNKPGAVFLGVVHRIDRPTSGVILFARTSKALERLNTQFKNRITKKTYWAITKISPSSTSNTLVHWMVRNQKQNKSYAYKKETPGSKKAILKYSVKKKLKNYSLLEIELETGRHHQIRSQLSTIGCPIKGDLKYGASRSNPNGGIHLHARSLEILHPVTKEPLKCIAPTPKDTLWDACFSD